MTPLSVRYTASHRALMAGFNWSPDRIYDDFKAMAIREARLKDGIEAVAIVTPNHMHFAPTREFLKRGIHVICDKPLTSTMADAKKMVKLVEASEALFVLTHNYTGYPLIRQAKAMIENGDLGKLRVVQVEYAQDWLTNQEDFKQAEWRVDPERSGAGGSTGDIGTHAFNLAEFVTGQSVEMLAADLSSFVPGRALDDNAHVMLRFAGGAKGMLWCSQVAPGNENGLRLRIFGEKGGLEWGQMNPNELWFTKHGEPKQLLTRNGAGALDANTRMSRIPAGHPEGYLEGFSNLYSEAANAIEAHRDGTPLDPAVTYPGIKEGIAGMQFIDACVRSSKRDGVWTKLAG